jgi:dCTP deaminase
MTALSSQAIHERLRDADPARRLVVSPLLDPAAQIKPGQAAVDVRLGFDFCLVTPSRHGSIDEFSDDAPLTKLSALYRREFVPLGSKITIHPHQFFLAQTLEYLRLPPDLMAYVVGRSTWGRLGLIVATAVGIHPGFAGSLTLELRNLGETPLTLYPGQAIAQLFFHQVQDADGASAAETAAGAQYTGTVDMVPRRLSDAATAKKLRHLKGEAP